MMAETEGTILFKRTKHDTGDLMQTLKENGSRQCWRRVVGEAAGDSCKEEKKERRMGERKRERRMEEKRVFLKVKKVNRTF
ncbi:uncharacterized protein DS421_6g197390 [Arachis hypogaea]|nr:uncharacterized protein DS421_6g197390 [Arachis hypogaea]